MKVRDVVRKWINKWLDIILAPGFKRYVFYYGENDGLPKERYRATKGYKKIYTEQDFQEDFINALKKCEDYNPDNLCDILDF